MAQEMLSVPLGVVAVEMALPKRAAVRLSKRVLAKLVLEEEGVVPQPSAPVLEIDFVHRVSCCHQTFVSKSSYSSFGPMNYFSNFARAKQSEPRPRHARRCRAPNRVLKAKIASFGLDGKRSPKSAVHYGHKYRLRDIIEPEINLTVMLRIHQ
jgi:hypothetical protein